MKKEFCDRCQKDCTFSSRGIKADGNFYIYLRSEGGHKVAHDELVVCMDCKSELEKVLEEFLTSSKENK